MSNILAIMRRDLGAYFTSPIGYIFMMVFVTISVGLYITSFFMFPVADMRPYFDNLPLLLCVFVPAVTMRIWAEERKENTWEMLLTFPMQARELVLGKFFAAVIFFAVTVAATFTIPWMLFSLGNPDSGAIFSGYLGTMLLGAFFLSMGILFSGFVKDQIVAFVVTLLACFACFLVSTEFIAGVIDERVPGLGSLLSFLLGFFSHFQAFTRGVIELADVIYFLAWTAICLVLNVLFIDGRNRPGAKLIFAGAAGLSVFIGLLFNWLMFGESIARFDMTEDKVYTVSNASKQILSSLESPVQIKYYVSSRDQMPAGMTKLEQDVTDKLEELRIASGDKLQYTTVYMKAENVLAKPEEPGKEEEEEKDADKKIEERMLDKGVEPFAVRVMEQGSQTSKLVYSSLGIAYSDKPEEILPQIMPQALEELEYRLVSTVYKLAREKKPVVALVAPKEAVNIDPQMKAMLQQMGQPVPESDDPYEFVQQLLTSEKYDVQRVELTKESPLPDEYDTLMVINPRSLNDRQRWEINRALQAGKSVVLAVQQYEWDYRPGRNGMSVTRREEKPEINALLENYGLGVSDAVLMDKNTVPLNIQSGNGLQALLGGGMTVNLPMQVLVTNDSMAQDTAVTNRLSNVFYLWGTALNIDKAKLESLKLTEKTVMNSSPSSWERKITGTQLSNADTAEAPSADRKSYPLMSMIEGQFPDAFAGKDRPAWPKATPPQQPGMPPQPEPEDDAPEAPAAAIEPKPGKLVLIGCSQMFRKDFIRSAPQHLDLLLNSVDAITLDDKIVDVRGQKPIDRTIEKPEDSTQTFWRIMNYGLANLIIAGVGVTYFWMRRQSRNAYTLSMMGK